jgi:hypothetical protein
MKWPIVVLSLFCFAAQFLCAEPKSKVIPRLSPVMPFSSLTSVAERTHIPLGPIDPLGDDNQLNPGDSITALVTLFEKGERRTQWLIYLEATASALKVQSNKTSVPMILYSSTGSKIQFEPSPALVRLRILGPFPESEMRQRAPRIQDKTAEFSVDKGYLSLGLDRAAAIIAELKERQVKGSFNFSGQPFKADTIDRDRKLAESLQITHEDEQAVAGSIPALLSYFSVVQQIPGLQDIFLKVVDMPSLWSIIRHTGVSANITVETDDIKRAALDSWTLPSGSPAYYFPLLLDLNEHPALRITLVVSNPRPPLLACGGIVGFLVEKPGDKQTFLTLRVVGAHRSFPPQAPP